MKVTKVAFEKTIGMPNYSNDRPIVVECILEGDETKEQAWSKINKDMMDWHKQEYPHLYVETGFGITLGDNSKKLEVAQINLQDEKVAIAIENATSVEELGKLKSDLKEKHLPLYKQRLKQLQAK